MRRDGAAFADVRVLEGPILTAAGRARALAIGPFVWRDRKAFIEPPTSNDIDIPLDAIVGTKRLKSLEW
ncbi:MAG: hypothetical protein IAI50_20085 [Candidatus Eremiobacteraeota bacterium]|nr:hypothetical protein [Candidatus Eremiobacteraeota bacterium]